MNIKLELSTGKVLELTEEEYKELRDGNETVYVPYQRPYDWMPWKDIWTWPYSGGTGRAPGSTLTTTNVYSTKELK